MDERLKALKDLPVRERLRLVEKLWESIAQDPDRLVVTAAQRRELDRRTAAYRRRPDRTTSWSELRRRLRAQ